MLLICFLQEENKVENIGSVGMLTNTPCYFSFIVKLAPMLHEISYVCNCIMWQPPDPHLILGNEEKGGKIRIVL